VKDLLGVGVYDLGLIANPTGQIKDERSSVGLLDGSLPLGQNRWIKAPVFKVKTESKLQA